MVRLRSTGATLLVLALAMIAAPAAAQVAGPVPEPLQEVGVDEKLGAELPLGLEFRDEDGNLVPLSRFFDGERPVILTLNYYRCPMLCGLQLNGLVAGLATMDWTPGDEFELVTVSIDPLETPALATEKKANYLRRYDRPEAARGWHFLTGRQEAISELAASVGFGYAYDEETREYAHAAAIMVIAPDGRLVRYLYGIEYPRRHLELALLEASEGKIGSPFDRIVLYCYHYDPSTRRYAPVAMNIMRVGGATTALALGVTLGLLWLRDTRRRKSKKHEDVSA